MEAGQTPELNPARSGCRHNCWFPNRGFRK